MNIFTTKKHFWIPTTTWNLSDIFITESISPFIFYDQRGFGFTVHKLVDDDGRPIASENCLILYPEPFNFNPSFGKPLFIFVNENALDKNYLLVDQQGIGYYYKTIYLRKGNFQIRFFSEEDKRMFIANAKMTLEIKTLEKYNVKFFKEGTQDILFVTNKPKNYYKWEINPSHTSDYSEFQISFDKAFNKIKGMIYGLLVGILSRRTEYETKLEVELSKLRSSIVGLQTAFEMASVSDKSEDASHENKIEKIKILVESCGELYKEVFDYSTDNFSTIRERLNYLDELQSLRMAELKKQKHRIETMDSEEVNNKLREFEELRSRKEDIDKEIKELINEKKSLNVIKKSIKRPREGSQEFFRRQEVEDRLIVLREKISTAREGKKELESKMKELEKELSEFRNYGFTHYDAIIEDQFHRILRDIDNLKMSFSKKITYKDGIVEKDTINGLNIDITKLAKYYIEKHNSIDDKIDFITDFSTPLLSNLSQNEREFLKIIINTVLTFFSTSTGEISDSVVNKILKKVIKDSSSLEDSHIREFLETLYEYRVTNKGTFTMPENGVVLKNFISFIMKPYSIEELSRFLDLKDIGEKYIAFMIWGAFIGFANMPKTFTDAIFKKGDNNILDIIDDYLFSKFLSQ